MTGSAGKFVCVAPEFKNNADKTVKSSAEIKIAEIGDGARKIYLHYNSDIVILKRNAVPKEEFCNIVTV